MASLLVTGGAGFIGANFVYHWRAHHPGDALVVLDALTYAGNRDSLSGLDGYAFVHGDIRDIALVRSLLEDHAIDTVVHFAAESHVDRSIDGPDAFIDTNILGTHSLLKAAKHAWLDCGTGRPHRFHHVSTDEVYGSLGPGDTAFTEKSPAAPNSPYAASKAASDHLVRAYNRTYGLEISISNCSNNYGRFQHPEKLIPLCIIHCLSGRPLPIYGDGLNVRDWLHVDDHCRAIEAVLARGTPGKTYNVGAGQELTNLEVVEAICKELECAFDKRPQLRERYPDAPVGKGFSALKTHVADRPGHDRRYAIDGTKIASELGFSPRHRFETGLAETIAWYVDNMPWWRAALSRAAR